MALRITDDCIACGACDYVCPNQAIQPATTLYRIVAVRCTECLDLFAQPQCIEACPVDCILPITAGPVVGRNSSQ